MNSEGRIAEGELARIVSGSAASSTDNAGIVVGQALSQALGDRAGITRFASAYAPLDESLARVVIDLGKRPFLSYNVALRGRIGTLESWNARISKVEVGGIEAIADGIMQVWFSRSYQAKCLEAVAGWRAMLTRTPLDGYLMACRAIRDADLRESSPSTTAKSLRVIPKDSTLRVSEFIDCGERLGGNPYWYKDAEGNFLWAGDTNHPNPNV